uniref:Uncharacterized protein n=1 Tax=Ditylenchus dipsaci TaxID=166011 RepID=A0A915D1D6_9BILA
MCQLNLREALYQADGAFTPNENSVTPEDTAGTPEEELEKEKAEQEKLAKEDGDVSAAQSDANKSSPKEISVEVQPDALDEPGPVNHLIDAHTEKQDSHPVEEAKQKARKVAGPAELKQELQNKNVTDVLEEKKITDQRLLSLLIPQKIKRLLSQRLLQSLIPQKIKR